MTRLSFTGAVVCSAAALALGAGQAGAQRVTMRVGQRLTYIGMRWLADAQVVDNAGRPMSGATLAFRIEDPAIAAVSPRGEVIARRNGDTKLWAIAGHDSTSALIKVEQQASKFAFNPSSVRLDGLGAREPLKVAASDAAGVPVPGGAAKLTSCRSVNPRVATLTAAGEVVSVANGSTYIRCADRGIADSVKVDVQQRAVSAQIANKPALSRKTFGDTFSIRIRAVDPQGKDVVDARPTWASLNPQAVSVDPLTGKARAVNNGEAKIIVQVGDIGDSTTISVSGSPLFVPEIKAAVTDSAATSSSKAGISVQDIFMSELDTAVVTIIATDSAGNSVPASRLRIRIADTSVAKLLDSVHVYGVKPGQAALTVSWAGLDDKKTVFVRPKTVASAGASAIGGSDAADSSFHAPKDYKDSVTTYAVWRAKADTLIHTDPNVAAAKRNVVITAGFYGAIAEHLARSDSNVTEDRSGPLVGGGGTVTLFEKLELAGSVRTGTLQINGTVGEDLTYNEIEGSVALFPAPQIGLRLGYLLRGEKTGPIGQSWQVPRVSLVTRFSLIGDIVRPTATFTLMPAAAYSDKSIKPSVVNFSGETGLDVHLKYLNVGVTYYVEQFTFDKSVRVEDFSAIRFRATLQPW